VAVEVVQAEQLDLDVAPLVAAVVVVIVVASVGERHRREGQQGREGKQKQSFHSHDRSLAPRQRLA
jgi:hypothetical protein